MEGADGEAAFSDPAQAHTDLLESIVEVDDDLTEADAELFATGAGWRCAGRWPVSAVSAAGLA